MECENALHSDTTLTQSSYEGISEYLSYILSTKNKPKVYYVDRNVGVSDGGSTWARAFKTISEAEISQLNRLSEYLEGADSGLKMINSELKRK